MRFGTMGDYQDAKKQSIALWNQVAVRETVSAGGQNIVGLKADGTVVAVGSNNMHQCNVNDWTNIAGISVGNDTVALKHDGTFVMASVNDDVILRTIQSWENIRLPE